MNDFFAQLMLAVIFLSGQIYFAAGKKKQGNIAIAFFILGLLIMLSDHAGSQFPGR